MIETIRNDTVHLITLEAGLLYSYETKKIEITKEELEKYKNQISVVTTKAHIHDYPNIEKKKSKITKFRQKKYK